MANLRGDGSDPFDLTKALAGAAAGRLDPAVSRFRLHAEYDTAGDQQMVIDKIFSQLEKSQERCVLLGVTGSGKTFAMAHLIERLNRPTLVLSHNKTLARQLWQELSGYFPENAVEYFVSHYDYYQPEAYLPKRDLYIDKELSLNERIEQERFATVASMVSRPDVIAIGTVLLGAAALFQLADAMQVMAIGVLRGVQETRVPMIIATISYWLVGLPVAYTLGFPLGLGGVGVWLGLAAGLGLAAVLLMLWFWRRVYPRLRLSLPPEPVPPMPFPAT